MTNANFILASMGVFVTMVSKISLVIALEQDMRGITAQSTLMNVLWEPFAMKTRSVLTTKEAIPVIVSQGFLIMELFAKVI